MRDRARKSGLAGCVLALVALGTSFLGACGDNSEQRLASLLQDPLADVEIPFGEPRSDLDRAGSIGGTKPTPSSLVRAWTVGVDDLEPAVEALHAESVTAGWANHEFTERGFTATRKIDGMNANLIVTSLQSGPTVSLTISSGGNPV